MEFCPRVDPKLIHITKRLDYEFRISDRDGSQRPDSGPRARLCGLEIANTKQVPQQYCMLIDIERAEREKTERDNEFVQLVIAQLRSEVAGEAEPGQV